MVIPVFSDNIAAELITTPILFLLLVFDQGQAEGQIF